MYEATITFFRGDISLFDSSTTTGKLSVQFNLSLFVEPVSLFSSYQNFLPADFLNALITFIFFKNVFRKEITSVISNSFKDLLGVSEYPHNKSRDFWISCTVENVDSPYIWALGTIKGARFGIFEDSGIIKVMFSF